MKEMVNMLFKQSALVLAASLFAMASSQAATMTPVNLNVSVVVSSSSSSTACSLSTGMSISVNYTSGVDGYPMSNGSGTVSCDGTTQVAYAISAGPGMHALPSIARRAIFGGNYVNYQLKTIPGLIWDDATGSNFSGSPLYGMTSPGPGNNNGVFDFALEVFGSQTIGAGTYTDTVLLTATF